MPLDNEFCDHLGVSMYKWWESIWSGVDDRNISVRSRVIYGHGKLNDLELGRINRSSEIQNRFVGRKFLVRFMGQEYIIHFDKDIENPKLLFCVFAANLEKNHIENVNSSLEQRTRDVFSSNEDGDKKVSLLYSRVLSASDCRSGVDMFNDRMYQGIFTEYLLNIDNIPYFDKKKKIVSSIFFVCLNTFIVAPIHSAIMKLKSDR